MPTPSEVTPPLTASALGDEQIVHTTCPPEIIRASAFSIATEERSVNDRDDDALQEGTVSATVESTAMEARVGDNATSFQIATNRDSSPMKGRESEDDTDMDSPSPANSPSDSKDDSSNSPTSQTASVTSSTTSTCSSLSHEFSNVRVCSMVNL